MTEKDKSLYLELYNENQNFLIKAMFTISLAALPFILYASKDLSGIERIFTDLSFLSFSIILCFQLYTHYIAREGCDLALSEKDEDAEKAWGLFDKVRVIEKIEYWLFGISLGLLFLAYVRTSYLSDIIIG